MKHEELTDKILRAAFEVSNELGAGFLESVYQKAMIIALKDLKVEADGEVPVNVLFRDRPVGFFVVDILADKKVLLELKAVKTLLPEHQAQTTNYLKATGIEVGMLINFGQPKIEYKRLYRPD